MGGWVGGWVGGWAGLWVDGRMRDVIATHPPTHPPTHLSRRYVPVDKSECATGVSPRPQEKRREVLVASPA